MTDPVETPDERIKLDVELTDGTGVREQLGTLRSTLEAGLSKRKLDDLIYACQDKEYAFEQWSADTLSEGQFIELRETLAEQIAGGNDLVTFLEENKENVESDVYKDSKKILDKLVDIMRERTEEMEVFDEAASNLSGDVMTQSLGKLGDRFGEKMRENPLGTILFAGVAVAAAYMSWKWKVGGKSVGKYAFWGGAFLWAANYGSTFVTPDGRSALNHITDFVAENDGNLESVIGSAIEDQQAEYPDVGLEDYRRTLALGDLPFGLFLELFQRAQKRGSRSISMVTFEREARQTDAGKKIPDDFFKRAFGKNIYEAMEAIVGDNMDHFQKQADKGHSLTRVLTTELLPYDAADVASGKVSDKKRSRASRVYGAVRDKSTAAAGAVGGWLGLSEDEKATDEKGGDKKETAGKETAEKEPAPAPTSALERTLSSGVPGFEELHPHIDEKAKSATLMGFHFPNMEISAYDDATDYTFTYKAGGRTETFNFRLPSDEEKLKGKRETLQEWLELQMTTIYESIPGVDLSHSPEWDGKRGRWMVRGYPFELAAGLGPSTTSAVPIEIQIQYDEAAAAQSLVFLYDGQNLGAFENLEATLNKEYVITELLQSSPGLRAAVEGLGRPAAIDLSDPNRLKASIAGMEFAFHWNGTGYEVEPFKLSPSFVEQKVASIRNHGEFNDMFAELAGEGPQLAFRRTDRYWAELVEFKKEQILDDYELRLGAMLDSGQPVSLEQFNQAYHETLGGALSEFGLPAIHKELVRSMDNPKAQEKAATNFEFFGYSEAYEEALIGFQSMLESTYDFEGSSGRAGGTHNQILFELKQVWYERTKTFQNAENLSPSQRRYLSDVLELQIRNLLNDAQREGGRIDKRVTLAELEQMKTRLSAIPTYDEWVAEAGIVDTVGQFDNMFEQMGISSVQGGLNPDETKIHLKDGSIWTLRTPLGQPTMRTAVENLNPTTIDALVAQVRASEDFNEYYDDHLYTLFNGRNIGFQSYFTAVIDFFDNVGENAWKSLSEYKKWEALEHYEHDLTEIMEAGYSPGTTAAKVNELHEEFGVRYLAAPHEMYSAINREMTELQASGKMTTEVQFRDWFTDLMVMGYGADYRALITKTRDYYNNSFNYRGLESIGIKKAFDIQNLAMRLVYRYTQDLNVDRSLTQREEAYFWYVRGEVDKTLRDALDRNQGTSGTWLRTAIGADEIPENKDLDILDYEAWMKKYPTLDVNMTVPPIGDPVDALKDALGEEEAERIRARVFKMKLKFWDDKLRDRELNDRDSIDWDQVDLLLPQVETLYNEVLLSTAETPSDEGTVVKEFKKQLKYWFKQCKR